MRRKQSQNNKCDDDASYVFVHWINIEAMYEQALNKIRAANKTKCSVAMVEHALFSSSLLSLFMSMQRTILPFTTATKTPSAEKKCRFPSVGIDMCMNWQLLVIVRCLPLTLKICVFWLLCSSILLNENDSEKTQNENKNVS